MMVRPPNLEKPRWPAARDLRLEMLWLTGASITEIAERLGDGLSRNAIAGRRRRLNLAPRGSPIIREQSIPLRSAA
jgi:hypothetical protein